MMRKTFILTMLIWSNLLIGCKPIKEEEVVVINDKTIKQIEPSLQEEIKEAWNGANWGMSPQEIIDIFGKLNKLSYLKYCPNGYNTDDCVTYELNSYQIGNQPYDIHFSFIKNQLINIKFDCRPNNRANKNSQLEVSSCANEMAFLLEEKYGNIFEENIKKKEWRGEKFGIKTNSTTTKKTWKTDKKTIKYVYYNCSGECASKDGSGYKDLVVSYTPSPKEFKIESDLYNSAKNKI